MKKTILRSDELSCPSCIRKIETALTSVSGVSTAHVHFETGRIEVEHDETAARTEDLLEAVRSAGYAARKSAF